MICERCKRDITKNVTCNYCSRKIGFECLKSQKKVSATERTYICKDCWSSTKKRGKYKSYIILKTRNVV